jgi:hypothetical protein
MKNAPLNYTYYVINNNGLANATLLYRQHNYKNTLECCLTWNFELRIGYWVPSFSKDTLGLTALTQLQAEIFYPEIVDKQTNQTNEKDKQ